MLLVFVQLSTSFNMSGKSFFRFEGICLTQIVLDLFKFLFITMYVASFLTLFIRVLCTCLMLTGSANLMLPTWLHSAMLTLPKYSLHQHLISKDDVVSHWYLQVLLLQNYYNFC